MSDDRNNEWGQPVGLDLGGWSPPTTPPRKPLVGQVIRLVPVDLDVHPDALFPAYEASPDSLWTYLPYGPVANAADLREVMAELDGLPDWQVYVVERESEAQTEALGFLCYLRIDPRGGVIEIGGITLSNALQRTRAATETMYLLIAHAFDLGYRRVEWKCDALNAPSVRAAERLGFVYEGTFRQATHYKGRNRDTAWFAIIDSDWPTLNHEFERWLADDNFDDAGGQRSRLQH